MRKITNSNPHPLNRTRSDKSTSQQVVFTVANHADVDPNDLPPLYDSIDPDALDAIVEHRDGDDLAVSFSFAGYDVTVDGDTAIRVQQNR